ncbi:hypothetical protein BKA62DRAFT_760377 [Auriculariales sp. MPI-PUGE-AT-0066]|nr:hypothetical protein BKA62DRAFT_760377 [Auriculariales sp. MPI-PUGE-AT-0066]
MFTQSVLFLLLTSISTAHDSSGDTHHTRPSPVPASYYRPEYACPPLNYHSASSWDYINPLNVAGVRDAVLFCYYNAVPNDTCVFSLNDSELLSDESHAAADCPKSAAESSTEHCSIAEGYPPEPQPNCPSSGKSCKGSKARRYRREDNYTAWLRKRDNAPTVRLKNAEMLTLLELKLLIERTSRLAHSQVHGANDLHRVQTLKVPDLAHRVLLPARAMILLAPTLLVTIDIVDAAGVGAREGIATFRDMEVQSGDIMLAMGGRGKEVEDQVERRAIAEGAFTNIQVFMWRRFTFHQDPHRKLSP